MKKRRRSWEGQDPAVGFSVPPGSKVYGMGADTVYAGRGTVTGCVGVGVVNVRVAVCLPGPKYSAARDAAVPREGDEIAVEVPGALPVETLGIAFVGEAMEFSKAEDGPAVARIPPDHVPRPEILDTSRPKLYRSAAVLDPRFRNPLSAEHNDAALGISTFSGLLKASSFLREQETAEDEDGKGGSAVGIPLRWSASFAKRLFYRQAEALLGKEVECAWDLVLKGLASDRGVFHMPFLAHGTALAAREPGIGRHRESKYWCLITSTLLVIVNSAGTLEKDDEYWADTALDLTKVSLDMIADHPDRDKRIPEEQDLQADCFRLFERVLAAPPDGILSESDEMRKILRRDAIELLLQVKDANLAPVVPRHLIEKLK